jgi:superfamily II DNA/RNA helicase
VEAAPGSGLFVAFGVPLLDRLPVGATAPSALVLTASRERAGDMAVSLARLALATGHRVGALGVPWARPAESDIVFATPDDLDQAIRSAGLKLDGLQALVLDGAGALLAPDGTGPAAGIFEGASEPLQVVVVAEKLTPAARRWIEDHARRAVFVPPEAARGEEPPAAPMTRGAVRVHVSAEDAESVVPAVVHRLLLGGHAHVIVYARTIDDAADLGDALGLHGFSVGRPGESGSPVWLGVDPLEAREMIAGSGESPAPAAVVSADATPPPTPTSSIDATAGGLRAG